MDDPSSEIQRLAEFDLSVTSTAVRAPANSASIRRSGVSRPRSTLPSGAMSYNLTGDGLVHTVRCLPAVVTAKTPHWPFLVALYQTSLPSLDHATPRTVSLASVRAFRWPPRSTIETNPASSANSG